VTDRGLDIVLVSTNHWSGLPTSKQHLTWVLSRSARVLYVDPPIDVFSAIGRPRRWRKLAGLRRPMPNVWVVSPLAPAVSSDPSRRRSFHRRRRRALARISGRLGMRAPVLWTFSPEHGAYAGAVGESLTVYHVADDLAAMSAHPETVREMERAHVEAADLVLVVSERLLSKFEGSGKAHRLPNAADAPHYRRVLAGDAGASLEAFADAVATPGVTPREFAGVPRPILLYGGAAYRWFDADTFLELARLKPGWTFAVVGPPGRLKRPDLPANVLTVGRRPYDEFPWYVACADAAVMPWLDDEITRCADPIGLYEYLLCGKPVVASPFPAALERGAMVRTARTAEEFAGAVEAALEEDRDRGAALERMRFGFGNTWEDRAGEALSLIRDRLAARGGRAPGGAGRGEGREPGEGVR
jgi:glycosyltransferase involved in cell wall biosynthesis